MNQKQRITFQQYIIDLKCSTRFQNIWDIQKKIYIYFKIYSKSSLLSKETNSYLLLTIQEHE